MRPTMHRGGIYKHLPIKERVVGQRYQLIENRRYQRRRIRLSVMSTRSIP
jgi:hypothetical protein